MRKLGLTMFVCAAMTGVAVPAAAADPLFFQFDSQSSYVDVTENGRACLPVLGCKLSANLLGLNDVSIGLGESFTFDFAKFKVSAGFGGDDNAQVEAALAFTSPVGDAASTGATISYLRLGGFFTPGAVGGSIVWDTPAQQFTAADGSQFTIQFNNLYGVTFGNNANASATITVDRIGPPPSTIDGAVPEPASWAMMLGGFGAVGGAMRARRRTRIRFA